jgi:general stress protein 26
VISADLAAFLEGGVSIHIATRDNDLEPHGASVAAVKVDADGEHITAYLPRIAASQVIADLESNRQAALGFGRPSDDHACQVKGLFLTARAASAQERKLVERQWEAFLKDLMLIGFPRQATEGWRTWPSVAIRLRVTAIFSQTPGPGAGAPLP